MISPLIREYSHQIVSQSDESSLSRGPIPKKKYWTRPKKNLGCDNLPLVEAARSEMTLLPVKTPVSVLQELLSRRGTTPKYELVQIEGAIHEPTFRYRVTVADTVAIGTGRSKKEAKHAAAKNVLEKLVGNAVNDEVGLSPSSCQVVSSFDKISGNPIGTLQEMCISRRWPPPTYEMTCEEGLPHERQFTITCVVFKYHEIGSGKSKKLAKRQAAYKMWERLQKCPLNPSQLTYGDGIDESINSAVNRYSDVKNSKISALTTPHSHKVSTFHKNLKQSSGEKLNELQVVHLNETGFNFVQFLQEIATEQQFEVTYVDIEEKSRTEKCQCLVQLSTLPVAVCYGSGTTSKEAQSVAAHNALEYLKIMTKNPLEKLHEESRYCYKLPHLTMKYSARLDTSPFPKTFLNTIKSPINPQSVGYWVKMYFQIMNLYNPKPWMNWWYPIE